MYPDLEQPARGAHLPVTLRVLGPFDLRLEGDPASRPLSRKGQWLLALLALRQGRDVDRAWLAGMLWPETPQSLGLYNLRRDLAGLRRALGAAAGCLRSPILHTLRLDLPGIAVDVIAFDAAIARGDRCSLEEAVALYRGPLLEGCTEEWAFQERQVREQAYLTALEALATQAMAQQDPAPAERHLRRVLALDPLRETAQRALMQALAAGGNYSAAILAYRGLRLHLHRELNAPPDAETEALFQQIRVEAQRRCARPRRERGDLGARSSNLPQPISSFIGRGRERVEVRQRLGTTRLLTLTGAGGAGKTRLALQVAAELLPEYPDGVWQVELAPLSDPAVVLHTVASVLSVREEPEKSLAHTLVDALMPRKLLLLLDNCEHLIEPCAGLANALLAGCPDLQILATSRQPLGLTGEVVWRVPSLSLPPEEGLDRCALSCALTQNPVEHEQSGRTLDTLMQYEAVRLFVERAAAVRPGFRLTPQNAAATVQVCRQLDGMPLAIELAAARMNVLTVDQIAARLDDRFRLLRGGSRVALPRHQTLQATIDWSHELLSEPERILLRRLSVFARGWTLPAAEAVCSGVQAFGRSGVQEEGIPSGLNAQDQRQKRASVPPERLNAEEVLDLLSQLVDKSLVVAAGEEGEARYHLLETVRQYSEERLLEAGEAEAVRRHHRDWFLALAERGERELQGTGQAVWLERLEAEHDNLRAAMDWSAGTGEAEAGLRLGGALRQFWYVRGYWSEGRERLERLLALSAAEGESAEGGVPARHVPVPGHCPHAARRIPQPAAARAKALHAAGVLAFYQADSEAARSLYEESLAIWRELGDAAGIATSLHRLGDVASVKGNYAAARSLYEQGLAIRRELKDQWEIAASLYNLGRVAELEGDYQAARSLWEESLAIRRALGDRGGIAGSLWSLGMVARLQGDNETAYALLEESLSIQRALGSKQGTAAALRELGLIALDQGEAGRARALLVESLALAQALGWWSAVLDAYLSLGNVALQEGDAGTAEEFHQKSLALAREIGERSQIALSLYALGRVAYAQGDDARARTFYRESLEIQKELGNRAGRLAGCFEGLAQVACREGQMERAGRLLGAAAALREAVRTAMSPPWRAAIAATVMAIRAALGEEGLTAAWAEGQRMPQEQAVREAMGEA